ncbi:MAG: DEAD/DEAH box helicase family protein [Anaerolineae bacterium]|nr:DEAD/DEAH box helicase family protein [Anaerolineae bacterium]
MPRIYVSLDLELTGLDVDRDEIIEIGLVRFRGDEVLETFTSLVHSDRRIPLKIEQMVGISQAEIDAAPPFSSLRGKILSFVKHYPLVGHNVLNDLAFLARQGLSLQNMTVDTFELATILLPEAERYTLASLAEDRGIDVAQSHRALADAMTTRDLFLTLVQGASSWDRAALEEMSRLANDAQWPLLQVFRDILSERDQRDGGSALAQRETGRMSLAHIQPEPQWSPLKPTEEIEPLDLEELSAFLSPGGPFERSFAGYEYRTQQIEMLQAVGDSFNYPTHLLVEAGTGTGKSLAYLLPAILFAVRNGRRVIVSSNTINLQDQLYTKDIPDLKRILPLDFQVALLKGRSNYICLRSLNQKRRAGPLSIEEARVMAKILAWLPQTQTGDRAELLLINEENAIWSQFGASSETCMGELCPFRQSGQCFFYRARARAERAHIVIINHALLLSDLVLDNRILPEYRHVIIDEAHHLEEQATNQFGFEAGRQEIYAFLNGLGHERNNMPGGLLASVPGLFVEREASPAVRDVVTSLIDGLLEQIEIAERRLYELFNTFEHFLDGMGKLDLAKGQTYDQQVRLTSGLRTQPEWSNVEIAWESLSAPLKEILDGLERLLGRIEAISGEDDEARNELAQEVRTYLQRGTEIWMGLDSILFEPQENGIYWFSLSPRTRELSLHSAPLHIGPTLQERLFSQVDTAILTSATLRTAGSFDYISERLGLEDPVELALDSPFDLKSAVLLYVPKDIPEPNQPYYQKQVEAALVDLCKATEGRMLVLFTSNSQLHATYHAIQRALEAEGIVLFGQGIDGSRRQILESFRTTPKAVLLGTRSFWEGVDIVGQALSCLVIVRLPFAVPTDPILAARAETFEDAFNQYHLPEAILRFRQGFGRLIRSRDDYGIIVLLDKRILTRSYGATILRSLPPCTARQGPLSSLPNSARRWLDPSNRPR